ncbi:hypothetical protein ACMYSO_25300 (plasmid) [Klebsiella sp. B345]
MKHVKGKIQQGAGNAYYAGMQWRAIGLIQNKAEYMALILDIKVVKVG